MITDADHIYYCTKNQVRVGGDMVILPWNKQKMSYLRLHTTHALDFWYSNRYDRHLLLHQKSGGWIVYRRSSNYLPRTPTF